MITTFSLADNSRARYFIGASMYFAQGVPYGLLSIAVPAWLATQGVGAGDIATFLAVIILPWAFKLLSGPLMDHFQIPAMGRRRPWVLGAQLGLTLSFLSLILVEDPVENIGLLMLLGVLINTFAATQDVAVDGMAIDLTPVAEQGRLNAFMAFGKAIGWSISAAVSGILLVNFGLPLTAIVAAAVTGAIFLGCLFVLERDGERLLPWSRGEARSEPRVNQNFLTVLKDVNASLWSRVSLVLIGIMVFDGLVAGYGSALMPIAAVQLFGYSTEQWSQLVAVMGLIGAAGALALGPLIDRFGAKRMLALTVVLVALHAFLLAETQYLWQNTLYVQVMLSAWIMLGPITMVSIIALAMAICKNVNSATQFAIYMSMSNLGASAGSKLYGAIAEQASYVEAYALLGMLTLGVLMALFFHRGHKDSPGDSNRRRVPRYTGAMAPGEAGMFWSGAMRCPKCRADMEQVTHDQTQVDRCVSCHGLWFDPGEVESLLSSKAAAQIDVGNPAVGKQQNLIDRYGCPRCGGSMARLTDPRQTHIWYEKCSACNGSFFDAGEFKDLASFTASDLFKSLVTPKRL